MTRYIFLIIFFALIDGVAFAGQSCPAGKEQLSEREPCIEASLFQYLYCLEKSGGGIVSIETIGSEGSTDNLKVKLTAQGKTFAASGGADVGADSGHTKSIVDQLQKTIDPSLAANCKALAERYNVKLQGDVKKMKYTVKPFVKPVSQMYPNLNKACAKTCIMPTYNMTGVLHENGATSYIQQFGTVVTWSMSDKIFDHEFAGEYTDATNFRGVMVMRRKADGCMVIVEIKAEALADRKFRETWLISPDQPSEAGFACDSKLEATETLVIKY